MLSKLCCSNAVRSGDRYLRIRRTFAANFNSAVHTVHGERVGISSSQIAQLCRKAQRRIEETSILNCSDLQSAICILHDTRAMYALGWQPLGSCHARAVTATTALGGVEQEFF